MPFFRFTVWFLALGFFFSILLIACGGGGGDSSSRGGDDDDDLIGDDDDNDDGDDDDNDDDSDDDNDDDSDGDEAPEPSDDIGVFVAKTGNDENAGTMLYPKLTINAGYELARAQEKNLFVAEGTYKETVFFNWGNSVSLFGGYEPAHWQRNIDSFCTIIEPEGDTDIDTGIFLHDVQGSIAIEGFTVHTTAAFGISITLDGGSAVINKNKVFIDFAITDPVGVFTSQGDISIRNNFVQIGSGILNDPGNATGISASGDNLSIINNNIVFDDAIENMWNSYGLFLYPPSGSSISSVLIQNNDIIAGPVEGDHAYSYGISISDCDEFQIGENRIQSGSVSSYGSDDSSTTGLGIFHSINGTVESNFILSGTASGADAVANGVYLDKVDKAVIINNIIQSGDANVDTRGIYDAVDTSNPYIEREIINNTFLQGSAEGLSCGIYLWGGKASLVNNIFYMGDLRVKAGMACGINNYAGSPDIVVRNNNIWSSGPFCHILTYDDICIDNLMEFNACEWGHCSVAGENISDDPLFYDPQSGNYHLLEESPCIDSGIESSPWCSENSIYNDFDGDARPQGNTWDIGADEYNH